MGLGMGMGWGLSSWMFGPMLYNWGYSNYYNPYYGGYGGNTGRRSRSSMTIPSRSMRRLHRRKKPSRLRRSPF